ncbi:hypothetical protein KMW28_27100 [Flammeovirga yaeyamensis]|uniref:Lipoprotein n=1 Tax=Flammeovirga yaeyamensis TaxID=367791 RepID=A0AAX1NF07_9BACT|nr:hypothetical protein [Flammeovirga yaeyamensis]MBB3700053.1 hypothetical protein [Flammeovirga yaeyamensis]NMF37511.1 hypothetical protein [Flammeovirga yaeyamensis]QWG04568.1 hypothetical protein KMW28_27100 [Flammeovirga yaeyamensis]
MRYLVIFLTSVFILGCSETITKEVEKIVEVEKECDMCDTCSEEEKFEYRNVKYVLTNQLDSTENHWNRYTYTYEFREDSTFESKWVGESESTFDVIPDGWNTIYLLNETYTSGTYRIIDTEVFVLYNDVVKHTEEKVSRILDAPFCKTTTVNENMDLLDSHFVVNIDKEVDKLPTRRVNFEDLDYPTCN